MTTELAKKEETAVATGAPPVFGHEQIDTDDLIIPKLLLMQGQSEFVNDGKAESGDLVKYPSAVKVSEVNRKEKTNAGTLFIPLTYTKSWVISEKVGNKYEFRRVEPFTPANSDAEWEFKENGTDWRRDKSIEVYGLLKTDVEHEAKMKASGDFDMEKALMPVVVSFRRTSYKSGRKIVTHFAKAKKYNVPAYVNMFKVAAHQETNELGTYYVLDIDEGGKTDKAAFDSCNEWLTVIGSGLRSGRVKVAEESTAADAGVAADDGEEQF